MDEMAEKNGCVHLILKALLLFIGLWLVWMILVYAGFGWVTEWLDLSPSTSWERDPRYFAALGTIPPVLITLIWLTFAAARARRRR